MFGSIKNGKILVLAIFLILGTLVATFHNDATSKGRGFWLEDAVNIVVSPLQKAFDVVGDSIGNTLLSFRTQKRLQNENKMLRAEVRRLSLESQRLREAAEENVRLRSSLKLKQNSPYRVLPASVIYRDPSNWFETCTVDRGRTSGIKIGNAVITYRGLVGQVIYAGPIQSHVRMLTDQDSGVGALVQRSRIHGMIEGQSTDTLRMAYLTRDSDIVAGDIIVTSGAGGMVPKGIVIGRVTRIRREGVTKVADVRPTVRPETVETVFVVPAGN